MSDPRSEVTPRAIILGLKDTGLAAMRLLGHLGIECWAAYDTDDDPALRSRYCGRRVRVTGDDLDAVGAIEALARASGDRPVLIPASDRFVGLVSDHRVRLAKVARFLVSPPHVVAAIQDKNEFSKVVAKAGLRAPKSLHVSSADEVRAAARTLGLPLIAKPAQAAHTARHTFPKTVIARTEDELSSLAEAAAACSTPLALQEYIPGGLSAHVSVAVCLAPDGAVVAQFSARKVRAGGDGDGVGTYVERVAEPAAEVFAIRLLRALEFVGVAEVELKRHAETDELVAIEINSRLWTQVTLPATCGLNFPLMLYRLAVGEPPPAPASARGAGRWQDGWEDFYSTFRGGGYRAQGAVTMRQWLTQSIHADSHAYYWLRDPGPAAKRGLDVARRLAAVPLRRLARRRGDSS